MQIRHARINDADDLLYWRNDPAVRSLFKNTEAVDRATHVAWLMGALNSSDTIMLIGERGEKKLGVVRFDRVCDCWSVSITMAPELRGFGHGSELLRSGLSVLENKVGSCEVIADIHVKNQRSLRLFERCKFVVAKVEGDFVRLRREGNGDQAIDH